MLKPGTKVIATKKLSGQKLYGYVVFATDTLAEVHCWENRDSPQRTIRFPVDQLEVFDWENEDWPY